MQFYIVIRYLDCMHGPIIIGRILKVFSQNPAPEGMLSHHGVCRKNGKQKSEEIIVSACTNMFIHEKQKVILVLDAYCCSWSDPDV